jgi:hypothetical protein
VYYADFNCILLICQGIYGQYHCNVGPHILLDVDSMLYNEYTSDIWTLMCTNI